MNEETQMTVGLLTGASSTSRCSTWQKIPWSKVTAHVFRLQVRIAKAEREGRPSKVKALQRLLTTSFYGRCLAVKRVTSNKGRNTPGVDGVTLNTPNQKIEMINELKRRGYTPLPSRRIYIPKKIRETEAAFNSSYKRSMHASHMASGFSPNSRRKSRPKCIWIQTETVDPRCHRRLLYCFI